MKSSASLSAAKTAAVTFGFASRNFFDMIITPLVAGPPSVS